MHINSLLLFQTNGEKTKNKKYHTVGIFPKSNRKIVERDKIDTPSTQIHDRSLSWLGTGISLQYKVTGLSWFYALIRSKYDLLLTVMSAIAIVNLFDLHNILTILQGPGWLNELGSWIT